MAAVGCPVSFGSRASRCGVSKYQNQPIRYAISCTVALSCWRVPMRDDDVGYHTLRGRPRSVPHFAGSDPPPNRSILLDPKELVMA